MESTNSRDSITCRVKRILGDGAIVIMLSILSLGLIYLLEPWMSQHRGILNEATSEYENGWALANLFFNWQGAMVNTTLAIMAAGVLIIYIERIINKAWDEKAQPVLTETLTSLSEKTHKEIAQLQQKAKDELRLHYDKTTEILRSETIDDIVNSTDPKKLTESIPSFFKNAYGSHTASTHSLLHAINENVLPHCDHKVPHRSSYDKSIKIVDNKDGTFTWHEICRYKIHCITFDDDYPDCTITEDEDRIYFNANYLSNSIVGDIKNDADLKKHLVKIKIGGEVIFDSQKDLSITNGEIACTNGVDASYTLKGEYLLIKIKNKIELKNAWTQVEVQEKSIIKDTSLTLHQSSPLCRANINVNLPDGWKFENIIFSNASLWNYSEEPDHMLVAQTDQWLLPGIIGHFEWVRNDQESSALSETSSS